MSRLLPRRLAFLLSLSIFVALLAGFYSPMRADATPSGQDAGAAPDISARAAIVVEYPSGRILYTKDEHAHLPPASTTKILTTILALEYGKLDDVFTVTGDDLVGESTMGLVSGETQTLHDLLYGMLLPSGNDAAMVVARGLANREGGLPGSSTATEPIARFAQLMNIRAAQLGLKDSHFLTPHGLDQDGHYSSAYDLASLSWYALHFPVFNDIVKTVTYDAPGHSLLNTNEMLTRYSGADGIKTGWTDAGGLCLVTSATRNGHRLISVVLNDALWYTDSGVLLDYGFAQLAAKPTDAGAPVLEVAQRGVADWLLQNGAPPPLLQATKQPQQLPPTPVLAQGGGAARSSDAASAPSLANSSHDLSAAGAGGKELVPWALLVSGLVGLALIYAAVVKFRGVRLKAAFGTLRTRRNRQETSGTRLRPLPEQRHEVSQIPHRLRAVASDRALPAPPRTLGTAPARERREPNLLVDPERAYSTHVARAAQLAWEDRQGSSMSEFLMALRMRGDLDVAEVVAAHQLNATAFLALARAQASAGHVEDAHRTLTHGILVLPHDRILRMAIKQIEASMCA